MQINILYGIEGAKEAKGIVVIVDIYRAGSVAAYALGQGVKHIIPVATKEEAFSHLKENSKYLLIGEEQGAIIEGFHFGNSPHELSKVDIKDKVLVHRSSQGTQGLVNASLSEELIFGSFPTISATASYILGKKPKMVSIVAMDGKGSEDGLYTKYLKDLLLGKNLDKEYIKSYIKNHKVSKRFLVRNLIEFPIEDIEYCLDLDRFNFVCVVKKEGNLLKIGNSKS